ncbi:hypothetical protein MBLNU457_2296t1 [Dothideomycetes sp. NU457]
MADKLYGVSALASCIAFTLLSLLFVCARLSTRLLLVKSAGLEELLILVAWVFSLLLTVDVVMQTRYGLGRHINEVSAKDLESFFKYFWFSFWIYNITLTTIKLSILAQYKRIFVTDWFQKVVRVMIGVICLYGLTTFFDCVFICTPVSFYWTQTGNGHCINQWAMFYANAVLNILTDLMIIILPMPVLKSLQVRKRHKIPLMAIFAIGGFVCIISALRLWLLYEAQHNTDLTDMNVRPVTWSSLEANLAIITSSLPTLKPLLLRVFPRLGSSTNSRTVSQQYSSQEHRMAAVRPSTFGRSLPNSRSARTLGIHKSTRIEEQAWGTMLEEGTYHGPAYRTEVEARRESLRHTPPGKIHVATTRTVIHDDSVTYLPDDERDSVMASSAYGRRGSW